MPLIVEMVNHLASKIKLYSYGTVMLNVYSVAIISQKVTEIEVFFFQK